MPTLNEATSCDALARIHMCERHARAMCSRKLRLGGLSPETPPTQVLLTLEEYSSCTENEGRWIQATRLAAVHCSFCSTSLPSDFEPPVHVLQFTCTILACRSVLLSLGGKNCSKLNLSEIFLTSSSDSYQLVCCEGFCRSSFHAWRQIRTESSNAC
jgi:hypothetical protein